MDSLRFSTVYHANLIKSDNYDDDMCQMDDKDDFFVASSVKSKSLLAVDDIKVPIFFSFFHCLDIS